MTLNDPIIQGSHQTGGAKGTPNFWQITLTLFEPGEGNPNFFDLPAFLNITSNDSFCA